MLFADVSWAEAFQSVGLALASVIGLYILGKYCF